MKAIKKPVFAVLGAGHGGLAMAGHLGIMEFDVRMYNRSPERIWTIQTRGGVEIEGEVRGFGPVSMASSDMGEILDKVDVVMVVVPATAHRFMAEQCAPHLVDGQVVILNPGRTFGALEFRQVLRENGCMTDVLIAEAQTFIYASRAIGPGQAKIFRIKNSIPVASIKAYRIPEVLAAVRPAFPQFVPGDNVFKTSFDNIGAIFHPAVSLLNTGWIEDISEFQFYVQGVTRSVSVILEKLDAERMAVAAAVGIKATSAREWLYLAYDATGKDLYSAMQANPGYRGIMAPTSMNIRYVTEDVPMSLVPIASLGKMLGVATPTMDTFIHLASVLHGVDYRQEGRTVERLGISGLSIKDLRLLAIGEGEKK